MKKEVTFNTSFRASTSRNIATEVPLQFAAVCNRFTLAQLREQLAATGYPWKEDDDALIKKYTYYTSKDDKYCLKEYERNLILRALAPSGIRELLSKMNEGYRNDLIQVMFEKYVTDSAPTLDRQSMEELAATYTVAAWLKNCGINIPAEPIILANIKQRELLQPFVELTECFAGRQDKLAELSDYVDWLPKSSLVGSITSGFRNIINWHDKAPMMITGIGGVGKSTLVAKFILDQINYQKNQKLPFIYFDFDKPGLSVSNPIELAVDAFRQLALLFPESEQIFTEIRDHLVEEFIEKEEKSNIEYATQSRGSDRSVIYEKYAKQFSKEIAAIKRPVLVVLDSFEEIQYRASPAELNNLFSFIREVSNIIPRLRPVFVGRAEAKYSGIEFDLLQLADFDQAAAEAFLYARGITDKKLQSSIYSKLGGQPLTLQLAANLVEKEKIKSTAEIEKIGSLLDETLIQEVLVKRNLQHTHGGNAEKIAIPGILMRKINPDIIQKVLADPCGFKDLTKTEAETIFEDLKKESFLIASTGADIKFRANLRIA
ncbi:MAG TPA: ATP-binding protein, partial [Chryseolinea sp.]